MTMEERLKKLNELGDQGWELVGVDPDGNYMLKMEKATESPYRG